MATRDTEGRREIEAARQRLTNAKSHEKFISKSLQSAKVVEDAARKAREDIQLQAISSKKEVEDAKKFLAEAEKRWEVIDVDADEEGTATQNEGSNKKRKISLSPQGNSNNNESLNQTTNGNASNSQSQGDVFHDCLDHNNGTATGSSSATSSSNNRLFNVNQIVVEGCGTSFTNGTYNRIADMYNGAPVYIKENSTTMAIFRHFFSVPNRNAWSIGQWSNNSTYSGSPGVIFYRDANDNSSQSISPPENDWEPVGGIYPLPTCRLVTNNDQSNQATQSNQSNNGQVSTSAAAANQLTQPTLSNVDQIVVEGCGNPQYNGTYKQEAGWLIFMKRSSDNTSKNTAIYRNAAGTRWVISEWNGDTVGDGSPGMYCYFTSTITNSLVPPENGWQSAKRSDQPAPTCRLITNNNQNDNGASTAVSAHEQYFRREQQLIQRQYQINAAAAAAAVASQQTPIPNEIDVVGAAIQSINGTYKRDEDEDRNGHPTYYKLGTLDGVLKEFIIYRAEGNNRFWYIGIPDEKKKFYMVRCDFSPDVRLPPKSDWVISIHGQSPSPNLQY